MNIRQTAIEMPDAWQHPFALLEKSRENYKAFFERALEIIPAAALLSLAAAAVYRAAEILYFFDAFSMNYPMVFKCY